MEWHYSVRYLIEQCIGGRWFISYIYIYFGDLAFLFASDNEVNFLFLLYLYYIVNTQSSHAQLRDTLLLFSRFGWLSFAVRLVFLCIMTKFSFLMKKVGFLLYGLWEQNSFFFPLEFVDLEFVWLKKFILLALYDTLHCCKIDCLKGGRYMNWVMLLKMILVSAMDD